jgi:ADP-heptose:LPS heptosyltransferase
LDGLAALIAACDIVVTVSNTTAHLAAALGKPALVMLPNNDSLLWYWHRDSHTTPWYPSVRLFRRSDTGRWEDVIDAVALTLAGII